MSGTRPQLRRRILAVLACTALLSLVHTLNHDALFGSGHHEDGDSATTVLAMLLGVAGGMLGIAAVAIWALAGRRRPGSSIPSKAGSDIGARGPALPRIRAGPGIPITLSVIRR